MKEKVEKILLIIGSCAFALLLVEITVRILDILPRPITPLPFGNYRLSKNPAICYEYLPGYNPKNDFSDSPRKGFAINRAGFRDYDYQELKPEGTYRIVVVGDSTTAGNGIDDLDLTYTKLLEKNLNQKNDSTIRYEVLNMGVGGYHTMQQVETLRQKGLKYDPDFVLVTFSLNDFFLHGDGGVYEKLLRKNSLSTDSPAMRFYGGIMRYSRLAFILYHRLKSPESEHDHWYIFNILKGKSPATAGFELLSELKKKYGFTLLIVILPEFRAPFDKYMSKPLHNKVFEAAKEFSEITVIDLLNKFAAYDNDAKIFSYDKFMHLNEYGHEVTAEILFSLMKNYIKISKSNPSK